MFTDRFRILQTGELPDGSKAWVAVAVHNREEKNAFVWEVHIVTRSEVESNVFSTEYPVDTPVEQRGEDEDERHFNHAIDWARQHIAQRWAKHEDFDGVILTEVEPNKVIESRFLRELPDKFVDVAGLTYSRVLKEWLTELASVPQFRQTESNENNLPTIVARSTGRRHNPKKAEGVK